MTSISAHGLVWRLAVSMSVGTFVVFVVGVLAPFLVADLGLSAWQVGALPSSFFLAATLTSPWAGGLTDRFGPGVSLRALNVTVATALCLLAASPNVLAAAVAVALGGVAAAVSNPATNRVVAEAVPMGGRGLAMGLKQAGVPVGSVLAGALLPTMAETWGWRRAILISVALPALGFLLTARLRRWNRTLTARPSQNDQPSQPVAQHGLRRTRAFAFLMGGASGLINGFLVLYLHQELAFTRRMAGMVAAAMGAVAVVSRIALAHAGERHASPRSVLVAVGVAGTLGSALTLMSKLWGGWAAWTGALLAGTSIIAFQSVLNLIILLLRPAHEVGRSSGFVLRGFFLGLLVTPVLFGWIVDMTSGFEVLWAGQAALCVVATWIAATWTDPFGSGLTKRVTAPAA